MKETNEKRLEQFEKMLQAVQTEYQRLVRQLGELKEKGKVRSITYQQLLSRKLPYQNMISMYELYDLVHLEDEERERQ